MKSLLAIIPVAVFPAAANAHVLDQGRGLVEQVGHQLLGSHHLPLLLLIGLAAWLAVQAIRRRGR